MNTLTWSNIEHRFVEKFDQMFSSNSKKAHFDCVPNEFSVVDGARSKWSQLLLLNALVGFIQADSFNLATRRKFDQQKTLKECIELEIESLKSVNLWDKSNCYIIFIDSQSHWFDVSSFRKFLEMKYPYKSKEKYFGIMDILLNHDALKLFDYKLIDFINAAINKINKTPIICKKMLLKCQKIDNTPTKLDHNMNNQSKILKSPIKTKSIKRKLVEMFEYSKSSIDTYDNLNHFASLQNTALCSNSSALNHVTAPTKIALSLNNNILVHKVTNPIFNNKFHKLVNSNIKNTNKMDENIYSFNADKVFEEQENLNQEKEDKYYEDTDVQPWILLDCSDTSFHRNEDSFTCHASSSDSKIISNDNKCNKSKSPTFSISIATEDSISTVKSSIYKFHFEPFPIYNEIATMKFLPF